MGETNMDNKRITKRGLLWTFWISTTLLACLFTAFNIGGVGSIPITDFGGSFWISAGMVFSSYGILSLVIMFVLYLVFAFKKA